MAVVEVGMGGRLDSTNVLSPLVSVITNISLDHTQFLGNTIEKIAAEKGGIIKPNTPVVIGRSQAGNGTRLQQFGEDAWSANYVCRSPKNATTHHRFKRVLSDRKCGNRLDRFTKPTHALAAIT